VKLDPKTERACLKLAGVKMPKSRNRAPSVAAMPMGAAWSVTLRPACRVISESNSRGHWSIAYGRARDQKQAVLAAWWWSPLGTGCFSSTLFPVRVTLIHFGVRLDDDNLSRAFKAVRDEVARLMGVDDGDERVEWRYERRTGWVGMEILIESAKGSGST
jgi:hypothetical protein